MYDLRRRVKNVEKKMNLSEKPVTITIVMFGSELPSDRTEGNINYYYEMYNKREEQ
jgi:hypothetical protein